MLQTDSKWLKIVRSGQNCQKESMIVQNHSKWSTDGPK